VLVQRAASGIVAFRITRIFHNASGFHSAAPFGVQPARLWRDMAAIVVLAPQFKDGRIGPVRFVQ
jgi:hypothetical protein